MCIRVRNFENLILPLLTFWVSHRVRSIAVPAEGCQGDRCSSAPFRSWAQFAAHLPGPSMTISDLEFICDAVNGTAAGL